MTLGERIKKLRKALDLTQQKFADQIGTPQNNIANYEIGRREPSAAALNNICKTFNVNETWLRTGEGEMFVQRSRDDELAAFVNELLASESADFRLRLVTALSRLKPEQWEALEAVSLELMKDLSAPQAAAPAFAPAPARDPGPELTVEQEVDQEVERYRQQLLTEKRKALQASSAKESGSA